jgi:hypothetical protein
MIVGSSQLWKKYYCVAFLRQMPNLFALFNSVFVAYIRFITVNKHPKSVFFNTNCKYVRF